MRLSTKISGIVAVGGVAALGAGLISSGGIGAAFTDTAQARADISAGTLACSITTNASNSHVINDGRSVAIDLGKVEVSKPDSRKATITVHNDGDIPLKVTWNVEKTGTFFQTWQEQSIPVPQGKNIAASGTRDYQIGAQWGELVNANMGTSGSVMYTATCSDVAEPFAFTTTTGGTASIVKGNLVLGITAGSPANSATGASASLTSIPVGEPATEPRLVSDNYLTGSPRLTIGFANGDSLIRYPEGATGLGGFWEPHTSAYSGPTNTDWSTSAPLYDWNTVSSVTVTMDSGQTAGTTDKITCVEYGSFTFGTGC